MTGRVAAVAFGLLALCAGGLQLWAFASNDYPRHLVVGAFAVAVGVSVLVAAASRRGPRWPGDRR
ncbi:hypothetical protein CIW49_27675 [Mycolicibacterium sp. P1-18]|uniref:hypothetical protein n=1 Tax=Mycolicibacterium sp. P1-18 TaxID=2024615 RepID=UPI0011F19A8A|nr:hypothetical protein [Mycolicibacterium sp. P1-18]KAA0093213.1 hypothetical protein CIW49_27675 [Mycolicibacterium sp. P1-18]